jgi:hypothetical protein
MTAIGDYRNIRTHLLVKITVPYYKLNPGDAYTSQILTFSDMNLRQNIVFEGDTYIGLGSLMNITSTRSELKPTSTEVTIALSGIPNSSIFQIVNSRIKGCTVQINRAYFDPVTIDNLNINPVTEGNVQQRFYGYVNNYSLAENYDVQAQRADNTLNLICKTAVDTVASKSNGRLTNPTSQKKWYPNDLSMDRVPALQGTAFNFGAP